VTDLVLVVETARTPSFDQSSRTKNPSSADTRRETHEHPLNFLLTTSTVRENHPRRSPSETTPVAFRDVMENGQRLFHTSWNEAFEDGMESAFSRSLQEFVRRHGVTAVNVITRLISNELVSVELASEALRWLGRMEDPTTYHDRRWLLEHSLTHSSGYVRDGAVLGLSSMDDPHATSALRQAMAREPLPQLRKNMAQAIEQLEATAQWPTC
jgi:hypothetical protein